MNTLNDTSFEHSQPMKLRRTCLHSKEKKHIYILIFHKLIKQIITSLSLPGLSKKIQTKELQAFWRFLGNTETQTLVEVKGTYSFHRKALKCDFARVCNVTMFSWKGVKTSSSGSVNHQIINVNSWSIWRFSCFKVVKAHFIFSISLPLRHSSCCCWNGLWEQKCSLTHKVQIQSETLRLNSYSRSLFRLKPTKQEEKKHQLDLWNPLCWWFGSNTRKAARLHLSDRGFSATFVL